MKRIVVGIALAAALVSCKQDKPIEAERPGDPAVYQRIRAETSCSALQAQFDVAAENQERDLKAKKIDQAKWSTGYMIAAEDRMRALGCH